MSDWKIDWSGLSEKDTLKNGMDKHLIKEMIEFIDEKMAEISDFDPNRDVGFYHPKHGTERGKGKFRFKKDYRAEGVIDIPNKVIHVNLMGHKNALTNSLQELIDERRAIVSEYMDIEFTNLIDYRRAMKAVSDELFENEAMLLHSFPGFPLNELVYKVD
jgi:hypothetical protein